MKTKSMKLAGLVVGVTLCAASAWASDYSGHSTDELAAMRGTMREAAEQDRNKFQKEWQKRVKEMPVEERAKYTGRPENAKQDGQGPGSDGKKSRNQNRHYNGDDKGSGYGQGGGYGHGGGSGHGGGGGGGRGRR